MIVPDAGQVCAVSTKLQAEVKGDLVGWDPARGKDTGYPNATNRWVSFLTPAQGTSTSHFHGNMLEYAKLNDGTNSPIPLIALLPR